MGGEVLYSIQFQVSVRESGWQELGTPGLVISAAKIREEVNHACLVLR